MVSPFRRLLLLALCVSLSPVLRAATDTAPAAAPAKEAAKAAAPAASAPTGPVLDLPTIEVRQTRIHEIDVAIRKIDKLIAREEKKVKSTELDRALNNAQVAHAAALFGGNSADHLSAIAAARVSLLQTERAVLEDMKRPATREALAMMEAELDQLRTNRRNLDNVER